MNQALVPWTWLPARVRNSTDYVYHWQTCLPQPVPVPPDACVLDDTLSTPALYNVRQTLAAFPGLKLFFPDDRLQDEPWYRNLNHLQALEARCLNRRGHEIEEPPPRRYQRNALVQAARRRPTVIETAAWFGPLGSSRGRRLKARVPCCLYGMAHHWGPDLRLPSVIRNNPMTLRELAQLLIDAYCLTDDPKERKKARREARTIAACLLAGRKDADAYLKRRGLEHPRPKRTPGS